MLRKGTGEEEEEEGNKSTKSVSWEKAKRKGRRRTKSFIIIPKIALGGRRLQRLGQMGETAIRRSIRMGFGRSRWS